MSRIVIEAEHAESAYWSDLWRYRELFFFLSWHEIFVCFKQAVNCVLLAVLRPLLTIAVFTMLFGKLPACFSIYFRFPIATESASIPA